MFYRIIQCHNEQADCVFHLFLQNYSVNMAPRRGTKHRPSYTNEDIEKAMGDVTSGSMSKRAAASKYAIPRSTLVDKLAGKYRVGKGKGRDPFLSENEELAIVE